MLETCNITQVVMPDERIINVSLTDYFNQDSGNDCETGFSVPYDTAKSQIPNLIETEISKHGKVLVKPYRPDYELPG